MRFLTAIGLTTALLLLTALGSSPAWAQASASHPAEASAAKASDPLPPSIGADAVDSVLSPSRPKRPLVRPEIAPGSNPLIPLGSEVPDAPVAAADAPIEHCAEPRASVCNLDYKPVCATVTANMACGKAPCAASVERKTFSSTCKACRDPKVASFVSGTCPKP